MSAGNYFTEVDLQSFKTTLITGKNGAGKSSLCESIFYALYGKPFRKIKIDQLINSINKKEMVVELYATVGKQKYKIVRGLKPKIFELYIDDVLVDQNSDNRDYQKIIDDKLIKTNQTTLKQIFMLGSATYRPFMELDSKERRSVIEDVLDIKVFSDMQVEHKKSIDLNKEQILEVKHQIDKVESQLQVANEYNLKLKNNNNNNVGLMESTLNNLIEECKSLIEQKKTMQSSIEELSDKIKQMDKKTIVDKMSKRKELLSDISHKRKTILKEVNFLNENDDCPVCKQHIEETFKQSICSKHETDIAQIDVGVSKLDAVIDNLNKELQEIETLEKDYKSLDMSLYKIDVNIKSKKNDIINVKNSIDTENKKKNESLDSVDITGYTDDLARLNVIYDSLLAEKEINNEISLMLKDDGIKSKIIKKYIPLMNSLINQFLDKFELTVNFELDENFDETIKSRYRDDFSYNSFSQGEKLRINLAIMLAWKEIAKKKNAVSLNLCILDETLDGALDMDGITHTLQVLTEINENENIIVISHRGEQWKENFQRHISFKKIKDFGVMEINDT